MLWGEDVIASLDVDRRYYRAQVEHELRSKMLRLRQKASGVLSDRKALTEPDAGFGFHFHGAGAPCPAFLFDRGRMPKSVMSRPRCRGLALRRRPSIRYWTCGKAKNRPEK